MFGIFVAAELTVQFDNLIIDNHLLCVGILNCRIIVCDEITLKWSQERA